MYYSAVTGKSYTNEKARLRGEKAVSRRMEPVITERTSDWEGTPTPEGVPPWPDTIESLFF